MRARTIVLSLLAVAFIVTFGIEAHQGYVPGFAAYTERKHHEAELINVAEAEKTVGASLLDPDAAKFDGLFVHVARIATDKDLDGNFVCGRINGKNSFGAYTGYHNFYYKIEDKSFKVDPQNTETLDQATERRLECRRLYSLDPDNGFTHCMDQAEEIAEKFVANEAFSASYFLACEEPKKRN